jgi:hypothetical protein
MAVHCDVTLFGTVHVYRYFREIFCLHVQDQGGVPPKHR